MQRVQDDVPVPQLHHRPRGASEPGRDRQLDNLRFLCGACNSLKGDRPMEYLVARLKETAA